MNNISDLLDLWVQEDAIRPLDAAFTRFLREVSPDTPPLLLVAAALTSFQSGQGHSCLELHALPDTPGPAQFLRAVTGEALLAALRCGALTDPESSAPLALVEDRRPRLYLRRYYRYEQTIHKHISARLRQEPESGDTSRVRDVLDQLFEQRSPDWARIACALALRSRFSLITGGPGTGKTTTVVRILAALCLVGSLGRNDAPRIFLAAPTGKAATRLQESIAVQRNALPEVAREHLPRHVSTIHRLLGMHGAGRSRYSRHDPLPADLVVIDEASMMNVELTARVLESLPEHARVIFLGDKDQLASVETGAVLADLCLRAEEGHYTVETARWINETTGETIPAGMIDPAGAPLDQAITMLRFSYRFSREGGIGRLADAVRRGAVQEIPAAAGELTRLTVEGPRDARFLEVLRNAANPFHCMRDRKPTGTASEELDQWAREILHRYMQFRVLCALREGPWGVNGINETVRSVLEREGLVTPGPEWYPGRPVIVTRNDYRLNLMNGDIGVALPLPTGLHVAFDQGQDRGIRWIIPGRLQSVETVYAMTVHKSQGSEFDHLVLVLPDRDLPVLTRELVYTAITRARSHFTLVERYPALLDVAVSRQVERSGGLDLLLHPDAVLPSGE